MDKHGADGVGLSNNQTDKGLETDLVDAVAKLSRIGLNYFHIFHEQTDFSILPGLPIPTFYALLDAAEREHARLRMDLCDDLVFASGLELKKAGAEYKKHMNELTRRGYGY